MQSHFVRFAGLLSVLFLAACAGTPPHEAFPLSARDQVASTESVVGIRQHEIYVFVPPSTAGATAGAGFGIIGALVGVAIDASVDAARTSKAEAAVKPLRDATVDYDFDAAFRDDLKGALQQDAWLHAGDVKVIKEVTDASLDSALAASPAAAVLFTTVDYHLSNDGDDLFITLGASVFGNNDALRGVKPVKSKGARTAIANSLYHNTLVFRAKVPGWAAGAERDHNIAGWSAQNGAAVRAALTLGAQKLAAMLTADLQRQDADVAASVTGTMAVDNNTGDVVGSDADGSVVRFKDGTLIFVAK